MNQFRKLYTIQLVRPLTLESSLLSSMSSASPSTLRQRTTTSAAKEPTPITTLSSGADEPVKATQDEVVWGKTPSGEGTYLSSDFPNSYAYHSLVFRVPVTYDVLTLFHPSYPKSHLDIFNLSLLGLQLVLFALLPQSVSRVFFVLYFAFWRAAYDAGLGWVLTQQSKKKWIVRQIQKLGWLDEKRCPKMRAWIRDQLKGKMGKDYSFDVRIFAIFLFEILIPPPGTSPRV